MASEQAANCATVNEAFDAAIFAAFVRTHLAADFAAKLGTIFAALFKTN